MANLLSIISLILPVFFGVGIKVAAQDCDADPAKLGDTYCDAEYNIPSCAYDGGDCCNCTCVNDHSYHLCGEYPGFTCLDPSCSDEVLEAVLLYPNCTGSLQLVGDHFCHEGYNNPSCGYDGGDCCNCTCVDEPDDPCGENGFNCLDPACVDEVSPYRDTCTGDIVTAANGQCDEENNNASCGYDGGDCCLCTCADYSMYKCGAFPGFNCLDPDAPQELYECQETPVVTTTCSPETQTAWVVEDLETATALAEIISCSHGAFDVEWRSTVAVGRAFYIANGTSVNITGVGSNAGMDGQQAKTRLFTVDNASLHISNMRLMNGNASVGGAIAAARSTVTLERTYVVGNNASTFGGALYVDDVTNVSLIGETRFVENYAAEDGGAVYLDDAARVSCTGKTFFVNNSADDNGGAVVLLGGSSILWDDDVVFSGNWAGGGGGAVYGKKSKVSGDGEVIFSNNRGYFGGAMYIFDFHVSGTHTATFSDNRATFGGGAVDASNSSISWSGNVMFAGNSGSSGAALSLTTSTVSWDGELAQFIRNEAWDEGGALYAEDGSVVTWSAATNFSHNTAYSPPTDGYSEDKDGGAIFVTEGSSIVGEGVTTFEANAGSRGGAVCVVNGTLTLKGNTSFSNNNATADGGAVYVTDGSSVSWHGSTVFVGNEALGGEGGGLYSTANSSVSWSSQTLFSQNRANISSGGAISVDSSASVSWTAETTFIGNEADRGGALFLDSSANVSWTARTIFVGNEADRGGAVFIGYASTLTWSGSTDFTANLASSDGGAVGASLPDSAESPSALTISGSTSFTENTCGANGGGMVLTDALYTSFETTSVTFSGNSAAVAGGAVFISTVGIGPKFVGMRFTSNIAQVGGGVYATGSGTTVTEGSDGRPLPNPTMFLECKFDSNVATATGGAIESAAGIDSLEGTSFVGNKAGTGGALRLAGNVQFLINCSFVDNVSDEGGGPAISSIGYMQEIINITFENNVFDCVPETFLDYEPKSVVQYATVCNGCDGCDGGCTFDGREPLCSPQLAHSNSTGGNVTLETLSIEKGHWRATASSREVLPCYNAEACLGGLTEASGYCHDGYQGPYCSVCTEEYTASLSFTCIRCSENTGGIAFAVIVALLAIVAFILLVSHLLSGEATDKGRGIAARVSRFLPLQSIKIVFVAWQILTQFTDVANVVYPDVYAKFLDGINLINFDLSWILSSGCILNIDFHDRLLLSTIGPLVGMAVLGATYAVALLFNRGSEVARENVRQKHISMVLLLTFFVYSSVSATLFQMFACEELEDGGDYLRADYRILCDSSKHRALMIYAGVMIALYPVGIPVFYGILLFRNRHALEGEPKREDIAGLKSTAGLWGPYKPRRFYYEVIECGRRILLAGVVVFIYPNTAAQIAVTLLIGVFFIFVSEVLDPYASAWDTWVSRMGHAIVFTSMYLALLLKVDVSSEQASSQRTFEIILVSAHAVMILVVILESAVVACAMRAEGAICEETKPRFRNNGKTSFSLSVEDVVSPPAM